MKFTLTARTLVSAVSLAVVAVLAGCSGTGEPGHDMGDMTSESSSEQQTDEAASFNDADVMFAQMMIPHHQQAIEMSDVLLDKDGIDAQVTDLATQIKQAQGPEIDTLSQWLAEWGAEPAADGGHGSMGDGMMSEDDMQALDEAQGAEAQRLFLEQMIAHHKGAIEMAQTEVEDGENPQAVAMAQTIVETQSSEIETMEDLLAQ
jgi:uncharacterized protein (DUF305 family)